MVLVLVHLMSAMVMEVVAVVATTVAAVEVIQEVCVQFFTYFYLSFF